MNKSFWFLFMSAAAVAVNSSITVDGRRHLLLDKQPYPRAYEILPYATINSNILALADTYPDWINVTTAQEVYDFPRTGDEDDCSSDEGGEGCLNYILTVQDFTTYPVGSESSNKLPEVFWSGALHGDERVGPTAVTEAVSLLVEAAHCESLPSVPPIDSNYAAEFESAVNCRNTFLQHGISDFQRQWLARLVRTRRLVIMPTPNALGYSRNERTEGGVDPNRDFPFDNENPQDCMQTIAARSINEVFREHMFQLALTFHGGTEVIGYEWGAATYLDELSPDDEAQSQIAQAYSSFAGAFDTVPPYPFGDMNTMVYFVRGGMEDWAYAASWDTDRVLPCEPTTFGGYPREKTIYDDSMLRVYNMLIETSHDKSPDASTLGTSAAVLTSSHTAGNGHISRNIRLALLALELVEPYVHILGVYNTFFQDPVFVRHLEGSDASSCFGPSVTVSSHFESLTVEWSVGGSIEVAETSLYAFTRAEFGEFDCSTSQMPSPDLSKASVPVSRLSSMNGTTKWHEDGASPKYGDEETSEAVGPVFQSSLDLTGRSVGDSLVVIATARVDPSWAATQNSAKPAGLGPQAHIVQARSNNDWHHKSAGKFIDGQEVWFSRPILLVIGDATDVLDGGDLVVEATNRLDVDPWPAPVKETMEPTHLRGSNSPSPVLTEIPTPSLSPTASTTTDQPLSPADDTLLQPPEDTLTGVIGPDSSVLPTVTPVSDTGESVPDLDAGAPVIPEIDDGTVAKSTNSESFPSVMYLVIIAAALLCGGLVLACIYFIRRRRRNNKEPIPDQEEQEEELVFNQNKRWSFRGVFDSSWYTGQSGGMAPQVT